MQEDIENHLGYKWLTGDKAIDHSTMGKFYAKYLDEIVELFSQVVTIFKKQDLIDFDILAIDSMKLRANASACKECDVHDKCTPGRFRSIYCDQKEGFQ